MDVRHVAECQRLVDVVPDQRAIGDRRPGFCIANEDFVYIWVFDHKCFVVCVPVETGEEVPARLLVEYRRG